MAFDNETHLLTSIRNEELEQAANSNEQRPQQSKSINQQHVTQYT